MVGSTGALREAGEPDILYLNDGQAISAGFLDWMARSWTRTENRSPDRRGIGGCRFCFGI